MRLWPFRRHDRRRVFRHRFPSGEVRHYDPAEVRRRLNAANPLWPEMVDAVVKMSRPVPAGGEAFAAKRSADADQLCHDIGGLVAAAFGLPPLAADGTGFTEADRINLLAGYLRFVQDLIERHRPLASAPPATASAGGG